MNPQPSTSTMQRFIDTIIDWFILLIIIPLAILVEVFDSSTQWEAQRWEGK